MGLIPREVRKLIDEVAARQGVGTVYTNAGAVAAAKARAKESTASTKPTGSPAK